jgi:hypothetical protein
VLSIFKAASFVTRMGFWIWSAPYLLEELFGGVKGSNDGELSSFAKHLGDNGNTPHSLYLHPFPKHLHG